MLLLAARLWFWAAVVRPLKHVVPLGTLVCLAHRAARLRAGARGEAQQLEAFLQRTGRAPARAPANCLERSIGVYHVLCASGAAPEIVVGIRRGAGNRVDGHVWVTLAGRPLAEDESFLATFARVLTFDAGGRQMPGTSDRLPDGVRLMS
jgi:hypothetical protein